MERCDLIHKAVHASLGEQPLDEQILEEVAVDPHAKAALQIERLFKELPGQVSRLGLLIRRSVVGK